MVTSPADFCAVLAHHLLFLCNRHGVAAQEQHQFATAARNNFFGPPPQPVDTSLSSTAAGVGSVTVAAVTDTEASGSHSVPTTARVAQHHLHRLAFLNSQGELSDFQPDQGLPGTEVGAAAVRGLGLTRPGQPMAGLPDQFTMTSRDVPGEMEGDEAGRDLPADVMRVLCSNLDLISGTRPGGAYRRRADHRYRAPTR